MNCHHYKLQQCLSCQWMKIPYAVQIQKKQQTLNQQLSVFNARTIFSPVTSAELAFRNKAKMAVLGTVERPILGIVTNEQNIDLCDCPLYSPSMSTMLHNIKGLIKTLQIVPYNLKKRKGELKYIILTQAQHQFMLRFVLRSDKEYSKITKAIPDIQCAYPELTVISINIQPVHAAILEGEHEIILTEQKQLPIIINTIPLFIGSGSFFQTNTAIAGKLYLTAKQWLAQLNIHSIWDLFCGVGGFGLHCISPDRSLIGIEINQDAIECAKLSAGLIGYEKISFQSLDATQFALGHTLAVPDLILVNPPRRGIGKALTDYLQRVSPTYILYSSCNLKSLIDDLKQLTNYQLSCVQLFDMFPHTEHMEVLILLEKISN